MATAAQRANRSEDEWDRLVDATIEILVSQGRQFDPRITYGKLNQLLAQDHGVEPFDLGTDHGRWSIGAMLAEVNRRSLPDIEDELGRKALLSVLVWLKDSDGLGNGFYDDARRLGMFSGQSSDEKLVFQTQQLNAVIEYCKRRR